MTDHGQGELFTADVANLTPLERAERVRKLTTDAGHHLDRIIAEHVTDAGKELAGIAVLFSGGNDSTILAHLFRHRATHAIHANTTIGIEQTRQFVRDTCAGWSLPLLEVKPPRPEDHYAALVLAHGFPGPAHHYKMFQRLKERGLREARRRIVTERGQRVIYLAGRRRAESERRASIPTDERQGSVIWCSPLTEWTALDLATYRQIHPDLPRNEVSDLLHMSGECLCGAFAHPGELDEIGDWFPDVAAEIRQLETAIADRADLSPACRKWGWGADELARHADRQYRSGRLCGGCADRWQTALDFDA